jgi:transcriptional regulator with XRE-family HTH domain
MIGIIERLIRNFRDEDYRHAYDEEFSNAQMATQIKVIREQRELTQSKLAELAGMKQSRISALENVNYSSWSISTLRRIARALGVRLVFKFESWGNILTEVNSFSRSGLERPSFVDDPAFKESPSVKVGQMASTPVGTLEIAKTPITYFCDPKQADERLQRLPALLPWQDTHLRIRGDATSYREGNN